MSMHLNQNTIDPQLTGERQVGQVKDVLEDVLGVEVSEEQAETVLMQLAPMFPINKGYAPPF